ncbi:MAG TPA: PAS domain S-box protein, partial [Candidatus Sulfotelmatobacter sp.]|nr:PAS domain S-box protein [Candidatus Sulfotelmatobacter sp.]
MLQRGMRFDWRRLKGWQPGGSAPSKGDAAELMGRYAVAVGCTALAFFLRLLLDPWLGHDYPFVTFLLALLMVLWWCGTGPAALVLVLGLPLAIWFFVPPRGTLVMRQSGHWMGMAGYAVLGIAIIWLGWLVRHTQRQLEFQVAQIARNRESLTCEVQERKQVEAALRQSEEEFRTAFEISAVGQAQAEPAEGRLLRVNSTYCRITGYSQEELLGKPHLELVDVANRPACGALFDRLVRGEIPSLEVEERYVRKDGRLVEVAIVAAMVRSPAGRPLRVTAIVQDITPRKQTQEALQQSERRFRAVVESNMVGIAFANLQTGQVLDANDAYLELIGRSREALRSGQLNFEEYTAPEHAPQNEAARQVLLRTGKPVKPFEKDYLRPDGSRVHILMGTAPLDPAREQAIAFVLDITERKRLERELQEREEEFRTSFELSAVGQAQADPVAGRFLRVNSGLCELTGYSQEQLLTMGYRDLVHPTEREQSDVYFRRLVQ